MGFTCPPLIPHLVREIKLKKKINRAEEEGAERRRGRENRVPIFCSGWELYLAAATRSTIFILCIKNSRWESYQRL